MIIKINVYLIDAVIDRESKKLEDSFLGSLSLLNQEKEKYKYLNQVLYGINTKKYKKFWYADLTNK